MISRNKLQLTQNNFPRTFQEPIKRLQQPNYTAHQKENMLPFNPAFANSRPLISPKKQQLSERFPTQNPYRKSQNLKSQRSPPPPPVDRTEGLTCINHPNKRAEFRLSMDDSEENYCGRCAAQLATQGCEVERIESGAGLIVSKRNELPRLPQYENEPIYQQIMQILQLCNVVVGEHSSNIQRFGNLENEYQQQADLTTAFYDRLIQIIEEMKEDHLSDLMQERDKYTQIADIQNDNLRENIIEVNVIKNDIQNHIEEVLEGIQASGDAAQCRESLDHYRQKLAFFRHRTEEQLDSLTQVTRYTQNKIDQMLLSFENFLKVMWDEELLEGNECQQRQQQQQQGKHLNSAMTVKNIHQILPKGVAYQGGECKRAFRNLQAQEQEEVEEQPVHERKSPNFKRI